MKHLWRRCALATSIALATSSAALTATMGWRGDGTGKYPGAA
jgi:hypothetical protein